MAATYWDHEQCRWAACPQAPATLPEQRDPSDASTTSEQPAPV